MMKCEPLQLHVDPDAKPVAIHKPALVPIHWQEKVFNDLERDVKIGVLEKVSPNTPVTWWSLPSRMDPQEERSTSSLRTGTQSDRPTMCRHLSTLLIVFLREQRKL